MAGGQHSAVCRGRTGARALVLLRARRSHTNRLPVQPQQTLLPSACCDRLRATQPQRPVHPVRPVADRGVRTGGCTSGKTKCQRRAAHFLATTTRPFSRVMLLSVRYCTLVSQQITARTSSALHSWTTKSCCLGKRYASNGSYIVNLPHYDGFCRRWTLAWISAGDFSRLCPPSSPADYIVGHELLPNSAPGVARVSGVSRKGTAAETFDTTFYLFLYFSESGETEKLKVRNTLNLPTFYGVSALSHARLTAVSR
jgi:hypothetical protein